MKQFVDQRFGDELVNERQLTLGPLEIEVMEAVWSFGAGNVREVAARISRPLAYTTVMTTLDRLYKKGLLDRQMADRAFVYSPRVTRDAWDRQRAGEMMADFLRGPQESHQVLLSCLVDAVGTYDAMLLDELERKIQHKREELSKANAE